MVETAAKEGKEKGTVSFVKTSASKKVSDMSDMSESKWSKAAESKALKVVVNLNKKANMGIPSKASIAALKEKKHEPKSFISKCYSFLEQKKVQNALHALLLLDIIIIMAELYTMIEFPDCKVIVRDCVACCPDSGEDHGGDDGHGDERWLAGGHDDGHHGVCDDGYAETGEAACDTHKYAAIHTLHDVLFWTTVTILTIFLFEALIEMATLGKYYWKQGFMVLDFVVVTVSLSLEAVSYSLTKMDLEIIVGILILFRLWRFVRIGHGIVEVTSELTSHAYAPLFDYIKECEKALESNGIAPPEKIERVKELCEGHDDEHSEGGH